MPRQQQCVVCGAPLEPGGRLDRIYCKPSCRNLAWRLRKDKRWGGRSASTPAHPLEGRHERGAVLRRARGVRPRLRAVQRHLAELQTRCENQAERCASLEVALEAMAAERERLNAERAAERRKMEEQEVELQRIKSEAVAQQERLRSEHVASQDKAEQAVVELRQALVAVHRQSANIEEEKKAAERSLAEARKALAALHDKSKTRESEHQAALAAMRTEADERAKQDQANFEDLLTDMREQQAEKRREHVRATRLAEQLRKAEIEIEAVTAQEKDVRARLWNERESYQAQLQAAHTTMAQMEQERAQLVAVKQDVEAKLSSPAWQRGQQLEEALRRIRGLERRNQELQADLAASQQTIIQRAAHLKQEAQFTEQGRRQKLQLKDAEEKETALMKKNKRRQKRGTEQDAPNASLAGPNRGNRLLSDAAVLIGIGGSVVISNQVVKKVEGAFEQDLSRASLPDRKGHSPSKVRPGLPGKSDP